MMVLTFALVAVAALLPSQKADPFPLEKFDATMARILPDESELRWKDVDWRVSLADGILDAQAAEKPILLWAMNGHPLGCV